MHSFLHKNEPKACGERGVVETWSEIGDVQVNPNLAETYRSYGMHGKVIGSFICDRIDEIEPDLEYYSDGYNIDDDRLAETCLTWEQLREYGKGVTLYGWHITEPKLFDKPKEFYELYVPCKRNKQTADENCKGCSYAYKGVTTGEIYCDNALTRPPQSWCYVEQAP